MTVRFRTEAVTDVSLARDWYDAQSAGLGESFVASLERTVDLVAALPSDIDRLEQQMESLLDLLARSLE